MSRGYTAKTCRSKKCRATSLTLWIALSLSASALFAFVLMALLGITDIAFSIFLIAVVAAGVIVSIIEIALGLGIFTALVVADEVGSKLHGRKRRK